MNDALDIGDVVVLNSGGPKMTVVGVDPNQMRLVWVNDHNELEQSWFPRASVYRIAAAGDIGVA